MIGLLLHRWVGWMLDVLSPASGDTITPDRKALAVIIVEISITCVSVWPLEMAVNKWCS